MKWNRPPVKRVSAALIHRRRFMTRGGVAAGHLRETGLEPARVSPLEPGYRRLASRCLAGSHRDERHLGKRDTSSLHELG